MIILIITATLIMTMPMMDVIPNEVVYLDHAIDSLFDEWYSDDPNIQGWHAEYVQVVVENWLRLGRRPLLTVDGEVVTYLPYAWFGDLNHDGVVNMLDFAIAAAKFRGRILKAML